MPVFNTSSGPVTVANWGYQLQDSPRLDASEIAQAEHDLIVMDFATDGTGDNRFSAAEIDQIKDGPGGRTVAVAYLSIGEASEFRDHWDPAWTRNGKASGALTADAPDWLGPTNPDWPESRKVRFWEDAWQEHIFNDAGAGWLDQIVDQGFDAAYLDIVDAYYYWAVEVPNSKRKAGDPAKNDEIDAAQRMIDFVVDMTAHARLTNPDFFVILQNGEFIMDALEGTDSTRKAALLDAIGAIAVEDTYFIGGKDQNNRLNPDHDKIKVLQDDFLDNDIPVLSVDYLSNGSKIRNFQDKAIADGFIPYAAHDRDLVSMDDALGGGPATGRADYLVGGQGRDIIKGKGGNDVIEGQNGNDKLLGQQGNDRILGGNGRDKLIGNGGKDEMSGDNGRDTLNGGKGNDHLTGGAGEDRFVFRKGFDTDRIVDFQNDLDTIRIDDNLWSGIKSEAQVLDEYGDQVGNHFVLTFGSGDTLIIRNTTQDQLLNDIDIF